MIIDCHYHFERRLLTEKALLKKMDDCGVEKVALIVTADLIPIQFHRL
jgi:predicted metal-dependent TIM-barrel fold hydrolase